MGIALAPGAANPAVQTLARSALTGDKHAQLALGIRYEEGDGVAADPKRARRLYRAAAGTTGGTIYVYVPATRKGGKGYVTPVNMGLRVEGLAEARARLDVSPPLLIDAGDTTEIRRLAFAAEMRFQYCRKRHESEPNAAERLSKSSTSPLAQFIRDRLTIRACLYSEEDNEASVQAPTTSQAKLIDLFVDAYVSYSRCNFQPCKVKIINELQNYRSVLLDNSPLSYAIRDTFPLSVVDRSDDIQDWWWPGRGICSKGRRVISVNLNSFEQFVCTLLGAVGHG